MVYARQAQGSAPQAPAIPKMEAPPPLTANQAREQARNAAQVARDMAQQARDAARQGTPGVAPPAYYAREPAIPKGAVDITVSFFATVALCVIGAPIARAMARRIDRRAEVTKVTESMTPQLRQLQVRLMQWRSRSNGSPRDNGLRRSCSPNGRACQWWGGRGRGSGR